jgi:hypothetical protein
MIQLVSFRIELASEAAELFFRERIGAVASRSIASGRKGMEIAGSHGEVSSATRGRYLTSGAH